MYASIDVRPAQEMMRRLGSRSRKAREAAIRDVLRKPSEQMPPVLYALANALSREPGRAYDAVFWYQVARLRAVFDALRCRDKKVRRAVSALGRSLTKELRGFQNDDPQRALAVAKRAVAWDLRNPRDYDHRWVALHGAAARSLPEVDPVALAFPLAAPLTYPETEWPDILRYVHETHLKSVQDFASAAKVR